MSKPTESSRKPAHEIRRGAIKAAIWRNEGENGPFFSFTLGRLYKAGDQWKTTSSFRVQDLPKISTTLVLVADWIRDQDKKAA